MTQPTARNLKVYVPAKDLAVSRAFYAALGFTVKDAWGGNVDCYMGDSVFRLQNYYVEAWAGNFMMQFDTDDANAWHEHAGRVIDSGGYGSARALPPRSEGNDLIAQIIHPSGVLLTFIQAAS